MSEIFYIDIQDIIIRTKDNIDEIKVLSMLKTINPEWKIDTTSDDEI